MRSTTMKAIAGTVARLGMLLFCVALAAAVCFELLRQYLSARYADATTAEADGRAGKALEAPGLALTMRQKIA